MCATVVGDVMGRYHPHGDSAAFTKRSSAWPSRSRCARRWSTAAAISARWTATPPPPCGTPSVASPPIAAETINEIGQGTVHFRPNYDGTREEPVVLPSKVPNLLLNGTTGIAVGMATNIPPHNLGEVCNALLKLIEDPEIAEYRLVANDAVRGPDFPHRRADPQHQAGTAGDLQDRPGPDQNARHLRTWPNDPRHADALHHQHPLRRQ